MALPCLKSTGSDTKPASTEVYLLCRYSSAEKTLAASYLQLEGGLPLLGLEDARLCPRLQLLSG
ncbi:hypothetical protein CLV24_11551 [Pontibacter ummariensis]|uniref:Uncharacterized protein n=1 Tax=Pontibacter ummariensis TaxID=1610492 RepID=A0A239HZK0_9BACT|nr:hypothetical protein CLV24_11551 [Pontibacter ummariensis]SNS86629.1 hypothetical protein SAMN06296052_11551 [Pontibacter ummariensis]